VEIVKAIGARLSKPISEVVNKTRSTPELKNVFEYKKRIELLAGAFVVDAEAVRGKGILLIDDLYRSGATAPVVAEALLAAGAADIRMLAMTKTRTRT
jgi:predicted amidophosphoribosyltransferase